MRLPSGELELEPEDRLLFTSDGVVEALGGQSHLIKLIDQHVDAEPKDLLNELVFKIKSGLKEESGGFPDQDCTVAIMDVGSNVIRLAKN